MILVNSIQRKVEDIFQPASNREILDRRAAPIRDKFKLGDSVQTTGGTGKIIKLTDKDMLIKWDLADMLDPLYYSFDNDIDRETLLRDVHVIREGKLFQYAFFEEDIFKPAGKRELKNRKSTEIEQAKARIMFKDEGFPEHSIYYGYKGEDGRFNDIGLIYNNRSLYPSSFNEDCIKIRCDVSLANGNKQFKVGELHKAKQWAERNVVGYLTNTYIDQVDEDIFEGMASARERFVGEGPGKITLPELNKLAKLDPTYPAKGKYIEWIAKIYATGHKNIRHFSIVKEFDTLVNNNQIEQKNIEQFKSVEELTDAVVLANHRLAQAREKKKEDIVRKALLNFDGSVTRVVKYAGKSLNLVPGSEEELTFKEFVTKIKDKMMKEDSGIFSAPFEIDDEIFSLIDPKDIIFQNSRVVIVHPKTIEKSQLYGRDHEYDPKCSGSRDAAWCTSYKSRSNLFTSYHTNRGDSFYIILPKSVKFLPKDEKGLPDKNFTKLNVEQMQDGDRKVWDWNDSPLSDSDISRAMSSFGLSWDGPKYTGKNKQGNEINEGHWVDVSSNMLLKVEDIFKPADKPELDRRKLAQQEIKRKEDAEKQAQYTKRLKALNKIPVKWDKKDEGSANGSKTVYFLGKYVDVDFTCDIEGGSPQTREDPGEPAYPMLATITSAVDEDGKDVPYTEALVEVVSEVIEIDDVDTSGWDDSYEEDWREDR